MDKQIMSKCQYGDILSKAGIFFKLQVAFPAENCVF